MPLLCSFYYCSFVVQLEARDGETSSSYFIIQDCFCYLRFFSASIIIWNFYFQFLWKMYSNFIGIARKVEITFHRMVIFKFTNLTNLQKWEIFSTFWYLHFPSLGSQNLYYKSFPFYFRFNTKKLLWMLLWFFMISVSVCLPFVHKWATDFHVLILSPYTLLKEFISNLGIFWWSS